MHRHHSARTQQQRRVRRGAVPPLFRFRPARASAEASLSPARKAWIVVYIHTSIIGHYETRALPR